ncbi:MAG: sensor histidine kinase [Phenylobacterium sp.]|uniref:sensor histidine kinase n=1 Tax=Phenylobacterium sp. TaxID=1871053 RepID=UPI00391C1998
MRPTRQRFGEFDIVQRWAGPIPAPVLQVIFGLLAAAASGVARLGVDVIAPSAGPFALIYPTVLIATLYGRWPAGAVAYAASFLYAWWYVLPYPKSFAFADPQDASRTAVNGLAALVVVAFAEVFGRAVRRAARERDQQIVARDLLLREIDHRMKNNFMIVASLLELQQRRVASGAAREALRNAAARVHSFAAAHQALYTNGDSVHAVPMADYLKTLTANIVSALFLPERIELRLSCDDARMPHDQAVSIGLVLNEAVTNAAKHAFGPDERGVIGVEFRVTNREWRLEVSDDGCGTAAQTNGGGLGASLIEAFAQRAGGQAVVERLDRGTRVVLTGPV